MSEMVKTLTLSTGVQWDVEGPHPTPTNETLTRPHTDLEPLRTLGLRLKPLKVPTSRDETPVRLPQGS